MAQAGSILVIWDYTRLGEDSRKFILLPGTLGRARDTGSASRQGSSRILRNWRWDLDKLHRLG